MKAVVGRMPLWAEENQDIETAMLKDSRTAGAEYRQSEGHDPKGLTVAGADDADGQQGLKNNPDGAE